MAFHEKYDLVHHTCNITDFPAGIYTELSRLYIGLRDIDGLNNDGSAALV